MATTNLPTVATTGLGLGNVPKSIGEDARSTAAVPLLNFLIHFAEQSGHYSDVIKDSCASNFQEIVQNSETPLPDESEQLYEVFMNLIKNGPGDTPVPPESTVTIVGAGVSGLCAGYELKKAGFKVRLLEASPRVGGRVITFRDPVFAPGLHAEGGAMRIPKDHYLLYEYIDRFKIDSLFDFEMQNKFIYLSGYKGGSKLTYPDFNTRLQNKDPELMALFPTLKESEKGKTCDDLFFAAVAPVVDHFDHAYNNAPEPKSNKIKVAYKAITDKYDKYTLRSYLLEVAHWSQDAIKLYDLGNAHVVFENSFIESFKDAFLSSNQAGAQAGMKQLQGGMDLVPKAFISPDRGDSSLIDNITFGARVTHLRDLGKPEVGINPGKIEVTYETPAGEKCSTISDYVVLAIPYTAQRSITKSRPFAPAQEQAIRDVRYVEVTKVLLQYQKRWWEEVFAWDKQGKDGGLVCDLPIRYAMFPKTDGNLQFANSNRGVVMAAYTFQQDATILGAMNAAHRVRTAAENLDVVFSKANSLQYLESGTSQVFPSDELAGGSAFCYFGPGQKSQYLEVMCETDWEDRMFFAGEQASYTHGWIQGALEAGLRCVQQVYSTATTRAT